MSSRSGGHFNSFVGRINLLNCEDSFVDICRGVTITRDSQIPCSHASHSRKQCPPRGHLRCGRRHRCLLHKRNLITKAQCDTLRLRADANIARQPPTILASYYTRGAQGRLRLLHADIDQRILAEHTLGIKVGRQVATLAC